MRRLGYWLAALLIALGILLLYVHWQFTVAHLSQETGTSNEASRAYAFWSGIGGLVTILGGIATGLATYYRHHNCHDPACWRFGHFPLTDPATGVTYRQCRIHHPHVPDELAHHGLFHHHFEKSHMDEVRARVLTQKETHG